MKISAAILVFTLLCVTTVVVMGTTIAQWTFESTVPSTAGPYSPEVGSGSARGSHAGSATYSSPAGNGSSHSFSANTWAVDDYWEFSVSTVGYESITLSWDQISSSTGPQDFALEYSTDGTHFTLFADYTVYANAAPNPVWNGTTSSSLYTYDYDLSSIAALDNVSTIYFQLIDESTTSANGGTVGTSGTDRVDNFTVSGNLMPANVPASSPGFAGWSCILGLLAVAWQTRKVSGPLPPKNA